MSDVKPLDGLDGEAVETQDGMTRRVVMNVEERVSTNVKNYCARKVEMTCS